MATDPAWDFDNIDGNLVTAQDAIASPESTNAQVSQVVRESIGEEPTIAEPEDTHVTLLGGIYWDGELLREAEVRELTGADEEELARVKGSPARWISVLLERAVVRIGDEQPTPKMIKSLLIGDRDQLLLGIRITTLGPEITAHNVQCPHCNGYFDATVDLTTIDRVSVDDPQPRHEYRVTLRRGRIAIVRLPSGDGQEAMFKADDATGAERNSILISHCLVHVEDPGGSSYSQVSAKELGMADRQTILRFIAENQPGPKLDDIKFEHGACGQEVILPITIGELFRGE